MMTWLLSLFGGSASGLVGYLLTGLAAIVGLLITFLLGTLRGAGKDREKQLTKDAKARDTADEIDDAVAGRTATENRKRLSKWASK